MQLPQLLQIPSFRLAFLAFSLTFLYMGRKASDVISEMTNLTRLLLARGYIWGGDRFRHLIDKGESTNKE